jgi:hypothetical protein
MSALLVMSFAARMSVAARSECSSPGTARSGARLLPSSKKVELRRSRRRAGYDVHFALFLAAALMRLSASSLIFVTFDLGNFCFTRPR